MKLVAPCFVLQWTEEIPAIGEFQDGYLKIISPPTSKRFAVVSPVVECEIGRERFPAPRVLIPDEWERVIVVPNSLQPYKTVEAVRVQTWTPPVTLRHLFPNLQPLRYSHWLLLPLKRLPRDAETSCHDTKLGKIYFVYHSDRTEHEKKVAANEEKLCIMAIENAFANTNQKTGARKKKE